MASKPVVRPNVVKTVARARTQRPIVRSAVGSVRAKVSEKAQSIDFGRYYDYAFSSLTNTTFLVFFAMSAYLCYNFTHEQKKSYVFMFVKNFVKSFPAFKDSGCKMVTMVLAVVPFIPAFLNVQRRNRILVVVGVFIYYVFLPEKSVYEYLAHGILVYLILRTNNKGYRIIGFALLFLAYVMQFAIPLPTKAGYTCATTDFN
uniref:Putative capsid protein n=1 Tax=Atrato Nege-like virus 1 TaxID=2689368 RepID=A0A6B9KTZ1_9VIRU|nr:putative capsid protein [Atrato Nege-like virus 1]